jgi:hypothetical protein
MTPIEILAAARELVEHVERLVDLELHPKTNAAAILEHHSEAGQIAETLRFELLMMDVPA